MKTPLLHVIIPAFGRSPYLEETLESASRFLPREVPITVIEDPCEHINLESLVKKFPRVQYLKNNVRLGIGGNFNRAIEVSSGTYTQICGSDDLFIGNPVDNFSSQLLLGSEIAAVGLDVEVINNKGQIVNTIPDQVKKLLRPKLKNLTIFENKRIFLSLMIGDWLYFPNILWKTEVLKKIKFDGNLHTAMDLDIFIRLLEEDKKIAFVKNKSLGYRRHDQSASSLYAKSIGRFEEEFKCHKYAIGVARNKNWPLGVFLAQVAFTVRSHAIMQSFLMVFSSPSSALKVLVKALSPIR